MLRRNKLENSTKITSKTVLKYFFRFLIDFPREDLDPDYDTDDSEKEGENEVAVIENFFLCH